MPSLSPFARQPFDLLSTCDRKRASSIRGASKLPKRIPSLDIVNWVVPTDGLLTLRIRLWLHYEAEIACVRTGKLIDSCKASNPKEELIRWQMINYHFFKYTKHASYHTLHIYSYRATLPTRLECISFCFSRCTRRLYLNSTASATSRTCRPELIRQWPTPSSATFSFLRIRPDANSTIPGLRVSSRWRLLYTAGSCPRIHGDSLRKPVIGRVTERWNPHWTGGTRSTSNIDIKVRL